MRRRAQSEWALSRRLIEASSNIYGQFGHALTLLPPDKEHLSLKMFNVNYNLHRLDATQNELLIVH